MNILLVEDNPDDVYFLRTVLADVDANAARLTHVVRLGDALRRLREERFDVALLDFFLPDSHGLDTLLRVRAQAPELPVVVLTGLEDEDAARRLLAAGAQNYVVKGRLDGAALLHTLREAIARHRQQSKPPAE